MISGEYQCCYTNLTGGKTAWHDGWTPLAISKDIPEHVSKKCINMLKINSNFHTEMVDESGDCLNSLEIRSDDNYVYMYRSQFGLFDASGRQNMFAHAYVFPWEKNNILKDPNYFLTIDKCNFKYTEDEAIKSQDDFIRSDRFDLNKCIFNLNISKEEYTTLIKCVYSQLVLRSIQRLAKKPLYIEYDGNDLTLRELIYCIYLAVPLNLRKELSFCSSPNVISADQYSIVFFKGLNKQEVEGKGWSYVFPSSCENNVLKSITDKFIADNKYITYFLMNYENEEMNDFFIKLDETVNSFNDKKEFDTRLTNLAFNIAFSSKITSNYENEELTKGLLELLNLKNYSNYEIQKYLNDLLFHIVNRNITLSDVVENKLENVSNTINNKEFIELLDEYKIQKLEHLPEEEAVSELKTLSRETFEKYKYQLMKNDERKRILELYYFEMLHEENSWEDLIALCNEIADDGFSEVEEELLEVADGLYNKSIDDNHDILESYNQFQKVMKLLKKSSRKKNKELKLSFWNNLQISDICIQNIDLYQTLALDDTKYHLTEKILNVEDEISKDGVNEEQLVSINRLVSEYQLDIEHIKQLTNHIINCLQEDDRKLNKELIKLSVSIDDIACLTKIVRLIRFIETSDSMSFDDLNEMVNLAKDIDNTGSFNKQEIFVSNLIMNELKEHTVIDDQLALPLDFWLILGNWRYQENLFCILDEMNPNILNMKDSEVLEDSEYFPGFIDAANQYISEKHTYSRQVKKWIKYYTKNLNAQKEDATVFSEIDNSDRNFNSDRNKLSSCKNDRKSIDYDENDYSEIKHELAKQLYKINVHDNGIRRIKTDNLIELGRHYESVFEKNEEILLRLKNKDFSKSMHFEAPNIEKIADVKTKIQAEIAEREDSVNKRKIQRDIAVDAWNKRKFYNKKKLYKQVDYAYKEYYEHLTELQLLEVMLYCCEELMSSCNKTVKKRNRKIKKRR